nr:ribonuclease H-like domain-containing protein [Tanacetum cinerariifolium]
MGKCLTRKLLTIVYNDALTSKSDFSTETTLCPQHIDGFDLKDETSLSEYNEEEKNVLYFNDLFPLNIIYLDDLKSDKDNYDNKIDIIQSWGGWRLHKNVMEAKIPKKLLWEEALRNKAIIEGLINEDEDEQLATIISLIKDNSVGKNVQANMEGHPNGIEAFISKIRNLRSPNGLVLFDVLVVLEYCVTLISVHKLVKDNKIFDEQVTTLEKNIFSKGNLDQNPSTSTQGTQTTDAMNNETDGLLKNDTWDIVDLPYDIKAIGSVSFALLVYVDYIIITGNNIFEIDKFKVFLKSKFMIKDLGKLKYFLGIKVIDTNKGICLNQRKYVLDLLYEYGMLTYKPAKTPLMSKLVISNESTDDDPILDNKTAYYKLMGKLIYVTNTRPDVSYVVHCLSQFMHSLLKSHLKIAFKILRSLKSRHRLGIHIVKNSAFIQRAIPSLHEESAMIVLGSLNYFLGILVTRSSVCLFLSQATYAEEILDRAHMINSNLCRTPVDNESILGRVGDPVTDLTLYRRKGRQGGDQGACKVFRCLLGNVIEGMGSTISMISISPEGFLPSILLLVVVIVTLVIVAVILVVVAIDGVVIVVMIIEVEVVVMIIGVVVVFGVSFIIKLSLVIIGNPSMKDSRSFFESDTIVGHKVAKSWNLLTYVLKSFPFTVRWRQWKFLEFKTSKDRYRDNGMSDLIRGLVTKVGENRMPHREVNQFPKNLMSQMLISGNNLVYPIFYKMMTRIFIRDYYGSLTICNCTEDCKVKFSIGTLTEDALSWWNSYAKPIGIEQANKIAWTELTRLLINKYCPRTEVRKMEDAFYNLVVKGNDLKTYARRFQELATLCTNMVPNNEKLMEVFIRGLPQSIKGTITASKP